MKSIGFGLALAVAVALPGAVRADNNVGCGLGTQLWEGKDDLVIQVLAATTNGIGFQTFGISSNTFGCQRNQTIKVEHRLNMFAGSNLDTLARDMAVGEGETLETMAALMGIEESDRASFYRLAKNHFDSLFPSETVTSGEMLAQLATLMADDATLARYVQG